MKLDVDKVVRDVLSRRDPIGYYVVIASNSVEVKNLVSKLGRDSELVLEEVGNMIIIRGKSRRIMEELARALVIKGLLYT